jgi:restriction system protein
LLLELIDILEKVPWWIGVVLAATTYIGLHQVAIMEVTPPTNTRGIGQFMGMQLYKTLAIYLQYVVPAACLIGSGFSAFRQRKRNALHAEVARSGAKGALNAMSWQEFEQVVGEHFRRQGFAVVETGSGGADGGVDLVLSRGGDRYFVQCKQWRARQVGVATVRELYGVMAAKGAAGGYVVTSGVFTDEARRFADGREIQLIDGDRLLGMIHAQGRTDVESTPVIAPAGLDSRRRGNDSPSSAAAKTDGSRTGAASASTNTPSCPQCGSAMVLRTARKGDNAGKSFWGCSTFPKCRGTRPA